MLKMTMMMTKSKLQDARYIHLHWQRSFNLLLAKTNEKSKSDVKVLDVIQNDFLVGVPHLWNSSGNWIFNWCDKCRFWIKKLHSIQRSKIRPYKININAKSSIREYRDYLSILWTFSDYYFWVPKICNAFQKYMYKKWAWI